jgi:hypothetical protein
MEEKRVHKQRRSWFNAEIDDYVEVFDCPECGKPSFCLDPGDGLFEHLPEYAVIEIEDDF